MKAALVITVLLGLAVGAGAQSLTAESLLEDSRSRVAVLEEKAAGTNGSLTVSVSFKARVLGKSAEGRAKYRIVVKDGKDAGNEPVGDDSFSDSTVAKMVDRQLKRRLDKPIMGLYLETAFPWARYLPRANRKREFTAVVDSDSAVVSGKRCYLISFTIDAEGDSMSAEGDGKIWLDTGTLLPVRTYRDFDMHTKRGRAEVKSTTDFSALHNGIPVMLRSETVTIPKFLFISVGSIKTIVEQSDFNLE